VFWAELVECSAGISAVIAPEMTPSRNPNPAKIPKKVTFLGIVVLSLIKHP
jgi:hypothetical protein